MTAMPKRDRDALRLAVGYLCCDNDFGCYRSDDEALADTLAAVSAPDEKGWLRVSRSAWRWYGTLSNAARVYVEVRRGDGY